MKRFDLVDFNAELLQKLHNAGVKLEDYKHRNLYHDYTRMIAEGTKRTAIILILSEQYHLSERQVYNIIRHFDTPVKTTP